MARLVRWNTLFKKHLKWKSQVYLRCKPESVTTWPYGTRVFQGPSFKKYFNLTGSVQFWQDCRRSRMVHWDVRFRRRRRRSTFSRRLVHRQEDRADGEGRGRVEPDELPPPHRASPDSGPGLYSHLSWLALGSLKTQNVGAFILAKFVVKTLSQNPVTGGLPSIECFSIDLLFRKMALKSNYISSLKLFRALLIFAFLT
jgi:hypothetical protein